MQETWVPSWVGKMPWKRKWQPTPVSLHGKSHGQRSLAGYYSNCLEMDYLLVCLLQNGLPGDSDIKNLPAMRETWVPSWVGKISWRRAWLPIPVFLPGESHGQRSQTGYSSWGRKESDTTMRSVRASTGTSHPSQENYSRTIHLLNESTD